MLLSLLRKDFPVDTNVGRICARLGWIPIEAAQALEVGGQAESGCHPSCNSVVLKHALCQYFGSTFKYHGAIQQPL